VKGNVKKRKKERLIVRNKEELHDLRELDRINRNVIQMCSKATNVAEMAGAAVLLRRGGTSCPLVL
jgi:hypothetical protein